MPLRVGSKAPEFELPDESGLVRSLADLRSGGRLLLYFYPADFTPVCTAQACMFRDRHAELAAAGVRVAGVSSRGVQEKARFKGTHNLPFTLLVDAGGTVAKRYGAWGVFGMPLGISTRRVSYLIDGEGLIAGRVASDLFVRAHERFVAEVLRGEV